MMADECAYLKRGGYRGRSEIKRPLSIAAFIGLAILAITCIIGAIVYHVPFKDERIHPPVNGPDTDPNIHGASRLRYQRVMRRQMTSAEIDRFEKSIKLITKVKLNVTAAAIYCRRFKPPAKLFFPRNPDEESILTSLLDTKSQEYKSPVMGNCRNGFFIGLRKTLDSAWMSPDGGVKKYSAPFMHLNYTVDLGDASSRCLSLVKVNSKDSKGKLLFNYINCERSDSWKCILCESSCIVSKTGACYSVYANGPEVIDYITAMLFCSEMANSPGELASVLHPSMLNEVYDQISNQMGNCAMVTIGNRITASYESLEGIRLSFQTRHTVFRPQRNAQDNCLIAHKEVEFWWEPADCTEPHCFVCKTKPK